MNKHQEFMRRALELAELGRGNVSPNPLVGCVIVHEDRIIGEGYHQKFGEAHAEVNAINSVEDPSLLSESTVYVTLEPCAHWGKTPPCANLLVEKKVKKVVIAAHDSNPLVGGKGIQILRDAGIEVETGLLEKEARSQNCRFFTQIEKKRPYVILKWAQTADGFVAREDFSSKWISNSLSRQLVHKWRAEEDAILVGKNTAQFDNPSLNVRDWVGNNPLRLVIDSRLELSSDLKLFDKSIPTICYNTQKYEKSENLEFVKLKRGFQIHDLLEDLNQRKVQSLIVEGGSFLLNKFIESELWDEARVFTSQNKFGKGISSPLLSLPPSDIISVQDNLLSVYYHV
ncbi:bifunctional diaminohydroxyphosphoribosylaminopyrimidine deaminase/5-amino-6-(5-phosphoribosylamino)uracil reductase RibD [Algoriphagus sp. CAU 1675]|uniref:bifunctional diaminohydroxyphosphoribosylaminopyrimidine deaminase/5-amino-6-(5-phosphoribosylamino)uracil reductase RibD n=1 Tax=Algoriphagus sp. CAU 1675 TaxID=3032597 RepID=UPI0023DCC41A|nr:bifunctional diaminohydroxyphosphoribosylaminopyrimidine deaminase/5-amino-6-(5-phosphoribosylamino)uracil reductase RibD [Algoriphagus sp. CAU 1675]MDF2156421.1 bifunctional diaminohydroxyphosphoribosylaminopyrimidine deaminase/5-amino-6-(5-phosphoribosylamino)uracil reductase RibD [Algoriphagus sp. CAU 1675]